MKLKQQNLSRRDRRWRGTTAPLGQIKHQTERAQSARMELARMLYGAHGR